MKSAFTLCVCLLWASLLQAQYKKTPIVTQNAIRFTENKKQWDDTLRYRADLPSGYLFVYANALQYSFYDAEALFHHKHPFVEKEKKTAEGINAHSFVVDFVKANPQVKIYPKKPTPEIAHYYWGNNPERWAESVKSYEELYYENLYKDIDYRIFSQNEHLKYEFLVKPNADARKIKMHIKYASKVELLPDGTLEIQTSVGNVYEKKPYSYQIIDGNKIEVTTEFVLKNNVVSFYFPKGYNKDFPLVIDPELIFSTYSGGRSDNWATTATFDNNGRLYSGGTTYGYDFPRFTGPIRIGAGGVNDSRLFSDIVIFRYNASGTTLEQLIFIGGNSSEVPHSLVVDKDNRLLIFGTTSSTNFPTNTPGGFVSGQATNILGNDYNNGSDLFVMRLNTNGTLNRSRIIGGTANDGIKEPTSGTFIHNYGDELRGDIFVDENKNIYIASTTRSNTISGVAGSLSGGQDGLVLKLNENFNTLWGRYLGGSNLDFALSIKVNSSGEVYVGGLTNSSNFPATTGGMHATARGSDDGFIAKFDANGVLLQSTYLGTSAADAVFLIDLDADQNVYAFGQTFGNYPVTSGKYSNPNSGQFIHKISADLSTSLWSTRIGSGDGQPDFSPTAFLVVTENNCGNIYIAGWGGVVNQSSAGGNNSSSDTRNLPTTPNALRRTSVNGSDFYLAVYKKDMESLLYATFFGENTTSERGDHVDGGTSRFSKDGTIYHAVCASCRGTNGFPTTPNAWARSNSSPNCNNAAFKISFDLSVDFQAQDPKNGFAVVKKDSVVCVDRLFFKNLSVGAESFLWQIFDQNNNQIFSQNTQKDFFYNFTTRGIYTVQLSVFSSSACKSPLVTSQKFDITLPGFIVEDSVMVCRGESVQLSASGAVSYLWTPSTYLNNPNIPNPIATPLEDITYTLTLQNDSCIAQRKVKITLDDLPELPFETRLLKDCFSPYSIAFKLNVPDSLLLDISDQNVTWTLSNGVVLQGIAPPPYLYPDQNDTQTQTFTITLTYKSKKCTKTLQRTIELPPLSIPPNAITPNGDGINDTFEIAEKGAKLQIWNRWGKRIYKTDNYQNEWGTQKEIVAGVYYYLYEAPSGATCKGWIMVNK